MADDIFDDKFDAPFEWGRKRYSGVKVGLNTAEDKLVLIHPNPNPLPRGSARTEIKAGKKLYLVIVLTRADLEKLAVAKQKRERRATRNNK